MVGRAHVPDVGVWSWWRQQLQDLAIDRARITLVTLGVIWGTLSLTTVLGFGGGLDTAMHGAMRNSGDHMLRLSAGATTRPFDGLPAGRRVALRVADADALARGVPALSDISIEYTGFGVPLVYDSGRHNVRVHGVETAYAAIRSCAPQPGGRFLNAIDEAERRRVAFLGDGIKQLVFGARRAVGQQLLLWGQPFLVVGVLRPKVQLGYYEGPDSEKVLIPASVYRALRGRQTVDYVVATVPDLRREAEAIDGLYQVLARRHRFEPTDRPAVQLVNQIQNMQQASFMVDGIHALMMVVAVLGMLVALVGVANVMYVMVEERRREFGVLLALGAPPRSIAGQRVLEGMVITLLGATIGVVLAWLVLEAMAWAPIDASARDYLGVPSMSLPAVALVAGSLGLAGGIAGYLPARRAANLQPVEALRDD